MNKVAKRHAKSNPSGSRPKAVELISACVALPQTNEPTRYRDITTAIKTATAKAFMRPTADWPDDPGATQVTAAQTYLAVLFRHLLRCLILPLKTGVASTVYTWQSQQDTPLAGGFSLGAGSEGDSMEVAYSKYTSGDPYHGTFLYPGNFKGRKYIWNDFGHINIQCLAAIPSTDDFAFTIWKYNHGDPQQMVTVNFPASTAMSTARSVTTTNDYYAVSWSSTSTSAAPVQTDFLVNQDVTTGYEVFAHYAFPNLVTNQPRVTGARILGNGLLLHNASADQYANGNWAAIQLGKGDKWTNYIGAGNAPADPYPLITQVKGCVVGDLKKGLYGYHKPISQNSMDLTVPFALGLQQVVIGCNGFDLENDTATLLCLTSPTGAGTLSHAFQLSWDLSMEFTTEDMWTMAFASEFDPDDWETAMMVISSMQQFYDNPVHWRKIIGTIGRLAHIAAPIASMFGAYGKAAGVGLSVLGEVGGMVGEA